MRIQAQGRGKFMMDVRAAMSVTGSADPVTNQLSTAPAGILWLNIIWERRSRESAQSLRPFAIDRRAPISRSTD
jgi:hypothetical protein